MIKKRYSEVFQLSIAKVIRMKDKLYVVLVALKKFYKPCFVPLAQLSKMKADGDITHINYCGCRVSINP